MKVMIRNAETEEIREYVLPDDGPRMIADLIAWIPEMEPSRVIENSFSRVRKDTLSGFIGPYLEIRRMDGDAEPSASTTVLGEVIRQRAIPDPTDPDSHELDCTCIFCIPGM